MATTVLILAHNEEATIARAIKSVANQKNVKICLLDDASTDNTVDIAMEIIGEHGIPYMLIQNEVNKGVAESANIAFKHIKNLWRTQFILRLDGDDELKPNAIEKLEKEYSQGRFVTGLYSEHYPDGTINITKPKSIGDFLACGVLINIDDIKRAGGFSHPEIGIFIEYDLYARLLSNDITPKIIDDHVYIYHRYNSSLTANKDLVDKSLLLLEEKWGKGFSSEIRDY